MHIKPLKHMQFTLITMKGSVFTSLFIILLLAYRSKGYPRSQMIRLTCSQQRMSNSTEFFQNFNSMMEIIDNQMLISNNVTTHTGIGPDSNYGLAECHGDLSADDCFLCYSEARTFLSSCFPNNGAQVFLDGCFIRTQNYSFYEEYAGRNDSVICGNTTRSSVVFRDSVRQAISDAVRDAPRNNDLFARETANESVYVLADCWNTLNETSCTECLDGAFATILQCLPFSEGRALHTGCFIRYSDTNFLNPEPTGGYNGEKNGTSQVIQRTCGNTAGNSSSFTFNFFQVMLDIGSKMKTSHFGTGVAGSEADKTYGLGQCYTDISTNDCNLCYVEARTALTGCIPNTGGRIYLKHCFLRYENYSFFEDYTGQQDRSICPNNTIRRNNAFEKSVRKVVSQAVVTATRSNNKLARTQALIPGTENNSVYAVSNCWFTLDVDSCGNCLQKAAKSILDCLPASEGYALFTGCFMRYNESSSVYPHHKTLSKGKIVAIVMAVSSIVAFLVVSIISLYAWKHRRKSKRKGSDDTKLLEILNSSSLNFKYSTIEKATSSFDEVNKLGQGGFGIVYKGVLPDGKEIAVKRLFVNHRHRARDFYNEVNMISSVDHKNLVKLVGFSCLGPESILIYEYLPNRSLDYFIFDAVRGKEVNWGKRYDIIVGIAEGLAYLHENSKTRIIHRDIKAANILLDSRLRAKIADFGLARSFQEDKNHISTGIAGTLGYMAPEYISHGKLTEKVDVYSFGVLLLEIVTGMSNRGIQTSEYTDSLVSIAWKHFKEGSADELFDPNLMLNDLTSSNMKKEIQSAVHIGLLCIQEVASRRPTMSMALQMLSKNIEPLPSPSNPPYILESTVQLNEFGPIHNLASVPTVSHSYGIPR